MFNKFLRGLIFISLLSMAYVTYLGLTYKKDEITTVIEVKAPVEDVYSYFADLENLKEWMPTFVSAELLEGNAGEVGAKYKMVFDENGKKLVMTETITEIKTNEVYAFTLVDDFMNGYVKMTFEPQRNGTVLTEFNRFEGKSFMARAMMGMFKRSIRQGKKEMYATFKEKVENNIQ